MEDCAWGKMLENMNVRQFQANWTNLEEAEKILIFGGHLVAKELYQYLKFHHMEEKVAGFTVSSKENNPTDIEGMPVKTIEEYAELPKDIPILLAVPEKFFAEIREHLHSRNYNTLIEIGNFGLAMLENQDVISYLRKNHPWMEAVQDVNEALCVEVRIRQNRMKLMPLAAYPFNARAKNCLKIIEKDRWLREILASETDYRKTDYGWRVSAKEAELEVYVVHSPKDLGTAEENSYQQWEKPILGGAVFSRRNLEAFPAVTIGNIGDDRGEHISGKNREYAEMTAAYWAWKNSSAEYKGISHYRRRYLLDEAVLRDIRRGRYDVVATVPRLVLPDVRVWFSKVSGLTEADIDLIGRAICGLYPGYKEDMGCFLAGHILYPNNMIIARSGIYDAYCTWLFSILECIETGHCYRELRKKQRYAAYAAELLTSLFLMHHRKSFAKKIVDYQLISPNGSHRKEC